MKFRKGTKMLYKSDNTPAYEKLDDEDFGLWVTLNSKYLVEVKKGKDVDNELRPESDKPLYDRNKRLNRFGWRWTDEQVLNYYKNIMYFEDVE